MNRDHLSIAVKSPIVISNDLVGRIIKKALLDGGFQKVEVYNQQGDPVPQKPLLSMLDAVRAISPNTFTSHVAIRTSYPDDTELTFTELLQGVEVDQSSAVVE